MQETTDYNIFKKIHGNRPINANHIQLLVQSIQENNLLKARPILVNENFEVIDGQNRLEAARILGVPIYYEKVDGLKINDVARINSNQRNWKLEFFLDLYCDSVKNPEYLKLREMMGKFDFSLNQAISFFIDEANINECRNKFKNGDFIFNEKSYELANKYKIFVNKVETYTKGIKRLWNQQSFIRAFIVFITNPEVDEKRLWDQIDKFPFLLAARPTKQLMLEMLFELYNYRKHLKIEN